MHIYLAQRTETAYSSHVNVQLNSNIWLIKIMLKVNRNCHNLLGNTKFILQHV